MKSRSLVIIFSKKLFKVFQINFKAILSTWLKLSMGLNTFRSSTDGGSIDSKLDCCHQFIGDIAGLCEATSGSYGHRSKKNCNCKCNHGPFENSSQFLRIV